MLRQSGNGKGPMQGIEALIRPLRSIETTWRAFDEAEKELVRAIGVPICMPNCGKCCETTTVMVWDTEVKQAVSHLLGNPILMPQILSVCEGWLTEKDKDLHTYTYYQGRLAQAQWESLQPEVHTLLLQRPCPFLSADKQCLIHLARPTVCRAYGVTRMPGRVCPRKLSSYETSDIRAHIRPDSDIGLRLRHMVEKSLQQGRQMGWQGTMFLATALFLTLRPQKLNELMAEHKIPTAKLIQLTRLIDILFQDQLNAAWAGEIASMRADAVPHLIEKEN